MVCTSKDDPSLQAAISEKKLKYRHVFHDCVLNLILSPK